MDDVVLDPGEGAGKGARHGQTLPAGNGQAPDIEAVEVGGPGARGHHRHVVAGGLQPQGEGAGGPPRPAGARRVHLAGENDPHRVRSLTSRRSRASSCAQCLSHE